MAEKKEEEKQLIKLNLACGQSKMEGYINIDKINTDAVDKVIDLETYPYPFEDNSIDEIFCSHYIEHVKDLISFMDEIYRILKPQGKVTFIAPYYSSVRASQDPTHVRQISENTFLYFTKKWREDNKLDHYGIKSDFYFPFQYSYILSPDIASKNDEARRYAIYHYWNAVSDIQVLLTKV